MKKIGKTVLCVILVSCFMGPIDREAIKEAYAKIYHFFALENVNPVIDAGVDLTEDVTEAVKESNIFGRIKETLSNSFKNEG